MLAKPMAADMSGDAAGRRGPACTNAHARPPELAEYTSATTNRAPDAKIVAPRQLGAGDGLLTSDIHPDVSEPVELITVNDRHLGDPYVEDLLRKKGLDELQIACIRSIMRQYIDSFLEDKDVELDEDAYRVLTNMLVHLIEESSKD